MFEKSAAKRIAVTGATGFIGSNLVRYLHSNGHHVRAIVRSPADQKKFLDEGIEAAIADVTSEETLLEAFFEMEAVIHLAALFNHPEASWDTYRNVNVRGTVNCVTAARDAGVNRFVYCSTVGVAIGPGDPPFNEQTPYHYPKSDKYETTKCEAEKAVREFAVNENYPVVVIRPAQVYGPGDLSKAKFYKMVKKGIIVNPGNTLKHLIYIDDLCSAFELVLAREKAAGEVFIVADDEPTTLVELIGFVAKALQTTEPKIRIPAAPVTLLCYVVETICNALHVKPILFKRSMDFFTRSVAFDTRKARTFLGFKTSTDTQAGVVRTVKWYCEQNIL